jgi:hypothetical protein
LRLRTLREAASHCLSSRKVQFAQTVIKERRLESRRSLV